MSRAQHTLADPGFKPVFLARDALVLHDESIDEQEWDSAPLVNEQNMQRSPSRLYSSVVDESVYDDVDVVASWEQPPVRQLGRGPQDPSRSPDQPDISGAAASETEPDQQKPPVSAANRHLHLASSLFAIGDAFLKVGPA